MGEIHGSLGGAEAGTITVAAASLEAWARILSRRNVRIRGKADALGSSL
jgi:hypothetical protein